MSTCARCFRRTASKKSNRHLPTSIRCTVKRTGDCPFSITLGQAALNNLYLETDHGIIDVLTSVLGVGDFARLKERAIKIPLYGRMILLISLEDLIVAKEAVGREKDLLAVKELRAIAAMRAKKQSAPDEKR